MTTCLLIWHLYKIFKSRMSFIPSSLHLTRYIIEFFFVHPIFFLPDEPHSSLKPSDSMSPTNESTSSPRFSFRNFSLKIPLECRFLSSYIYITQTLKIITDKCINTHTAQRHAHINVQSHKYTLKPTFIFTYDTWHADIIKRKHCSLQTNLLCIFTIL